MADPCRFEPPRGSIIPRKSWRKQMVRVWRLAAGLTRHATSILHFYTFVFWWANKSAVPEAWRRRSGVWWEGENGLETGREVCDIQSRGGGDMTARVLLRCICLVPDQPATFLICLSTYSYSSHYHSHKLLFTRLHHTLTIQTDCLKLKCVLYHINMQRWLYVWHL